MITKRRPRTILELGVWRGEHSRQMINAALQGHVSPGEIAYYGVDLFEDADSMMVTRETSKSPPSLDVVAKKLQPYADLGVSIKLLKGDSTVLLPNVVSEMPMMDFVFIDGGHSYETVKSDWECVQRVINDRSIVIFDDYVNEAGVVHTGVGVNRVVDAIDPGAYQVELLKPVDSFKKNWGVLRVQLVKVRQRGGSGAT
jgi:Methyltransferase domain